MKHIGILLLSFSMVFIGLTLFMYYLNAPLTIGSFISGFIGFYLMISPAINKWENYFKELFSPNEKND